MGNFILLIIIMLGSSASYASRMAEAQYLEEIAQYHDDGIAKSKLALSKSKNKEVEKLAKSIINDQTKEKKQLEKLKSKFYSDLKVVEHKNDAAKSDELQNASGFTFDKLYLEYMVNHHKDEIIMTSKMLPEINRDEVHHMAIKIVKNKGNGIEKIEKIKNSL